jgi:hypothetical protein
MIYIEGNGSLDKDWEEIQMLDESTSLHAVKEASSQAKSLAFRVEFAAVVLHLLA